MLNAVKSLFFNDINEKQEKKGPKIKSGIDGLGNPYIDLSDKNTAKAFMEKTKVFEGIEVI